MMDSQVTESRSPQQSPLPELEIPGLKVIKEVGRGGMARVYQAIQESLQRPVAVKLLDHPDTPGFHERFMNEGRYLAALSHSNIVEVYDVGECNGQYYIVMEYLPGGDLRHRIRQGMKPGLALKVALRIALCLDYLHEKGLVHRDLKPSNILFRADNNPVLTDFGVAKLLRDKGDLTISGGVLGSPSYLSPEQAGFGGRVDRRSDLYSLGVILFEMLTGERPYQGENFVEIIMAHHRQPIPELPETLYQYQPLVDRLLAKEMDDRFQSGSEFVQDLRELTSAEIHQLPMSTEHLWGSSETTLGNAGQSPRGNSVRPGSGVFKKNLLLLSVAGLVLFPGSKPETLSTESATIFATSPTHTSFQATENIPQVKDSITLTGGALKRSEVMILEPRTGSRKWVNNRLNKADRLLELAYQRMDNLRLSLPKGDSAYDYFQQILRIDPDHKAAKAGLRQIVRWYIDKAERAIRDKQILQAKRYIKRGLAINNKHPHLIELRSRIEAPSIVEKKVFDPFQALDM